jgi:hypothetical protein
MFNLLGIDNDDFLSLVTKGFVKHLRKLDRNV